MSLKRALVNSLFTMLLALISIGPILCFTLHGYNVEILWWRLAVLALVVFFGRFFFLLFQISNLSKRIRQAFILQDHQHIPVIVMRHPLWLLLSAAFVGILFPFILSTYWLSVAILALIYILLGLGLNIIVGQAGLLNLGYAAFYAFGAYTLAILTTSKMTILGYSFYLGFWSALPLAALFCGIFGALLAFPVLRMHGDYLAIVTLAFGEIIRLILINWNAVTGGPNGLTVSGITLFGLTFNRDAVNGDIPFHQYFNLPYNKHYEYTFIYFLLFITVCFILRLVERLQRIPLGRTWEALREDEVACRSLGINHVTTKLSAFSLGAMIGGIGGVFFGTYQEFVNPASFTFIESALILAIVVLGGMGSSLGIIIAAITLTLLPELLREFSEIRMLIFGLLMIIMMILRPRGLIRTARLLIPPPRIEKNG